METQGYGYTAHSNKNGTGYTYRPLVEVEVGHEEESATFKALIDSGTDITVMDTFIAEMLKINPEGCDKGKLSGLESWKDGFIAPVSLKIEHFGDITLNFDVLFIEDLSKNFDIILGQHDFFNRFDVIFKKSKNQFYLEYLI
jgi:hypothetical protein